MNFKWFFVDKVKKLNFNYCRTIIINTPRMNTQTPIFCAMSYTFVPRNPLRQIVVSRALTSTITEALAVNVFDVSATVRQVACDCDEHPSLAIYLIGFVVFTYLYTVKNNGDRLMTVEYYSKLKKNMRFWFFILFLIMGKNIDNAI